MTNCDTDTARDFRRNRLHRVRPAPAPNMLSEAEFNTRYLNYHVVLRVEMADAEEKDSVMFCPACQQNFMSDMVKARRLYITYENDPLSNFAMLATLTCRGCEWSEIIPVTVPTITDEQTGLLARMRKMRNESLTTQDLNSMVARRVPPEPTLMPPAHKLANTVWAKVAHAQQVVDEVAMAERLLPQIEAYEQKSLCQLTSQQQMAAASLSIGQQAGMVVPSVYAQQAMDTLLKQSMLSKMVINQQQTLEVRSEEEAKELARISVNSGSHSLVARAAEAIRRYRSNSK